jgi:hypothetical protein
MRWILTTIGSLIALLLSLPLLLLAAPFWAMSSLVRAFAWVTEPEVAAANSLVKYDPELGWRPGENIDAHYVIRNDDIYPLVTDASGWPGRRALEDGGVVIVGDSFAYGYGARPGESYIDLVDELQPKALASLGYDMVQEVLLMRKYARAFAGKLVIWWIYLENDLPDNMRPGLWGYRKPFVARSPATGEWQIVTSHLSPERWRNTVPLNNMEVLAHLCTPSTLSDHYYSACDYLIGEGLEACTAEGAKLVVMTIPNVNQMAADGHEFLISRGADRSLFDSGYPDRRIGEICKRRGIAFLPLMPRLQAEDYKAFERFHWEPSGHRKAAAAIREVWEDWRARDCERVESGIHLATDYT